MNITPFLIVNGIFGVPFAAGVGSFIYTNHLKKICTYPVKAKIKEIKFRTVNRTGSSSHRPHYKIEYYQVLEFEHYGGTHTVKGKAAYTYKTLGKEGDIVELLIDPKDGKKYIFAKESGNGAMRVLGIVWGVL